MRYRIHNIRYIVLLVIFWAALPLQNHGQESRDMEVPAVRAVPDSIVDELKSSKAYAYANDPAYWKKAEDYGWMKTIFGILGSSWMKVLLYILLGTLFLFVLYRILVVQGIFNLKSKKIPRKMEEESDAFWQESVESLEVKIREAERHKDYRKAIRYSFLQTLRLLDNRNLIHFDGRSTNSDYVSQLSGTRFADQFALLARIYDFAWYGEIPVSDLQYGKVQTNFQLLKEKVN